MVKYIDPKELASLILCSKDGSSSVLVVDVRDSDFKIGKVLGSINVPYCDLDNYLSELIEKSLEYQKIVFHCHFSAQRGPSSAFIFEEEYLKAKSEGVLVDRKESLEILILKGGFEKWHRLYENEPDLYEILN